MSENRTHLEIETEYTVDGEKQDRHEFIPITVPCHANIRPDTYPCHDLDKYLIENMGLPLETYLMIAVKAKRDDISLDTHVTAKVIDCIVNNK